MKFCSKSVSHQFTHRDFAALFGALIIVLCFSSPAVAHHSSIALYDTSTRDFEISGEIMKIRWRNPHIRILVQVTGDDGKKEDWVVEMADPNSMSSVGVTRDLFNEGDVVRVMGSPGRNGKKIIFGGPRFVFQDGRVVGEIPGDTARDPDNPGSGPAGIFDYGDGPRPWFAVVEERNDGRSDIFAVWISTPIFENNIEAGVWGGDIQLTEKGKAIRDAYDPKSDGNPFLSCTRGIPEIMTGFGPLDFIQVSENEILLRDEEFDIRRPIYMGPDAEANRPPKTDETAYGDVGYSAGYWEDENTLVVRTTGMNFPYYDQSGLPQLPGAEIVERWTLINNGNQLRYELTVTDPEIFLKPVTQAKNWNWSSTQKVKPFNCDQIEEL